MTVLLPEDDAATENWGEGWSMPSEEQWRELFRNEYTEKVWTQKSGKDGLLNYGYLITSKLNGKSIFIPAAGHKETSGLLNVDSEFRYWSNELGYDSRGARNFYNLDDPTLCSFGTSDCGRATGLPVRPVVKSWVYTEFVESTGTLTYYYDNKREERAGVTEPYDPVGNPDVARFTGYFKKVVKAVVDPSMKDAPLTSMRSMFYGGMNPETWVMQSLRNMTTIEGLENLNTATVTDMNSMFAMCEKLTTLDLSTFNTSNVTTFNGMFTSCDNLELVDVTSFDISKVTDMEMMFISCPKLTTICCFNDWSTSSAKSNYMFSGCKSLVGDKGTVFDGNVIDKTYARPDGGTGAPGYFTSDTMTGIKEMKNEERRIKNDIYNLSGQRLQKLQKGINIIGDSNGTSKKVLIK
ncbi:MAG: BspA family leucine-rich repeat surface protein [Bacteroidaceae bacterium]|nr:BspA family leucine-rich repeat surface protein [Bacteroidaceae bacterium]